MSDIQRLLSSDVRKPTALVHFEREMSLIEQKLMTLIIFHCQIKNSDERGFYYIRKSFIREFLGWDESKNYPRIYEGFEKIFDNSIKWNFLEADKTFKSLKCKLIVSLLEPSETGKHIGFKLHPDLEPLIKDPRVFAKIKLIMMSILAKPKYAFPLYEIITDFYSRGEHLVKMSLPLLRQSLGMSEDTYDSFIPFKKRVLKPNIEAINQNTDCFVSYTTYRDGRVVGGIVFTIKKQRWQPPLFIGHFNELKNYYQDSFPLENLSESNPEQSASGQEELAFIEGLSRYHITETYARAALNDHGLEGAREIRDYVLAEVERRRGTKDQVRDVGAYLARCLREGFGKKTEVERRQDVAEQIAQERNQTKRLTQEKIQAEADHLKNNFWLHQTQIVDERFNSMSPADRTVFDEKFIQENHLWRERFRTSGLETPLVRSAFYNFAVKTLLTEAERDIIAFALNASASPTVIHLIQSNGV